MNYMQETAERLDTRLRGQLAHKIVRSGLRYNFDQLKAAWLADDAMQKMGPAKNIFSSSDLSNPKYVLDILLRNFSADFQRKAYEYAKSLGIFHFKQKSKTPFFVQLFKPDLDYTYEYVVGNTSKQVWLDMVKFIWNEYAVNSQYMDDINDNYDPAVNGISIKVFEIYMCPTIFKRPYLRDEDNYWTKNFYSKIPKYHPIEDRYGYSADIDAGQKRIPSYYHVLTNFGEYNEHHKPVDGKYSRMVCTEKQRADIIKLIDNLDEFDVIHNLNLLSKLSDVTRFVDFYGQGFGEKQYLSDLWNQLEFEMGRVNINVTYNAEIKKSRAEIERYESPIRNREQELESLCAGCTGEKECKFCTAADRIKNDLRIFNVEKSNLNQEIRWKMNDQLDGFVKMFPECNRQRIENKLLEKNRSR